LTEQNRQKGVRRLQRYVHRKWGQAVWQAHRRFPSVVGLPSREGLPHERQPERDEKSNRESRLPEGEDVRVPMVWGTEFFGPGEIDDLFASLRRLGWDEDPRRFDRPGRVRQITEDRMYGSASLYCVGPAGRKGDQRLVFPEVFAPLPPEVEYVQATIRQLANSLTSVTVAFFLEEDATRWYAAALNQQRTTELRALKRFGSVSIVEVPHLKMEAIEQVRRRYRGIVRTWFAENMPGIFLNTLASDVMPIAELVVSDKAGSLPGWGRDAGVRTNDWRRLLVPGYQEVWTSTHTSAMRVAFDSVKGCRFHTVASLNNGELGVDSRATESSVYARDELEGMLDFYAVVALLREAMRAVTQSRERLRLNSSPADVETMLRNINGFFAISASLSTLGVSLRDSSLNHLWQFVHACSEFTTVDPIDEAASPRALKKVLADRVKHLAADLAREEASTRELFEQAASVLSIRESVKAQGTMKHLTVAALVVAFLSLVVALAPRETIVGWVDATRHFVWRLLGL
jgi:hypothetical protein